MIKKTILITFFVVFSLNINKLQARTKADGTKANWFDTITSTCCKCSSPYNKEKEKCDYSQCNSWHGISVSSWYTNFNIHNIVWHNHKINPDKEETIWERNWKHNEPERHDITVNNCISDTYLEKKISGWYELYAYPFADLLEERIANPVGSLRDRANRIVDVRKKAVAKIRSLAKEVGHGVNEGVLGSDDYSGISNDDRGSALEFVYDNGATLLPKFSAYVAGRLYVGKHSGEDNKELSGLFLETKPSLAQFPNAKEEVRREKILSNVDKIEFKFFVPEKEYRVLKYPVKDLGQGQADRQPSLGDLSDDSMEITEWSSKSYKMLPAMLQVEITRYDENNKRLDPLVWLFDLPNAGYKLLMK